METFKDGSQLRMVDRLTTEMREGGAFKILAKSRESWGRRMEDAVAREKSAKREREGDDKDGVVDVGKGGD